MANTWILSANAGRARFFTQAKSSEPFKEIHDMTNASVHLRTAETESDRIGQRSASKSTHSVGAPTQPSGYQPNQTPEEHQTELFARSIAEFMLRGHQEGSFDKLILVAAPAFLGVLRKMIDPTLSSKVSLEISKDYTQSDVRQLAEQIAAQRSKQQAE